MAEQEAPEQRIGKRRLPGPFRWGLVAGMIVPVVWMWHIQHRDRDNVQVTANGSDVSRHGGVRVVIRDEHGAVTQACNGICDDLSLTTGSSDNLYVVRVLDAAGRCVACDQGKYVTNGFKTKLAVSGDRQLKITSTTSRPY
jgi:hypothetical protein